MNGSLYKKKLFVFKLFFIICLGLIFSHLSLWASDINEYIIKSWTIEDGLPQNSILTLIQTKDGYIWFGTELGLVRFSGVEFRTFNRWNTDVLKNNRIVSLYESKDQALWIGTDGGGICRFRNGQWESYRTSDGLSIDQIKTIGGDKYGNLWIGTVNGLCRFKEGKFKTYSTRDGLSNNSINSILEDRKGNLWIATGKGLDLKEGGISRGIETFKTVLSEPVIVLFEDRSGNIWIGTNNGLKRFKDGEILTYTVSDGLCGNSITSIRGDNFGNLWIGTYGDGISCMKDGVFFNFSTLNGLTDDFIHSIIEDQEGNIWIGTYAGGIIRMKSSVVSNLTKKNGLPENYITTILGDHSGFLWIGTKHRGLCEFKGNKLIEIYSRDNGFSSNNIRALFKTMEGDLWVGTEGGGVNRLRNKEVSIFTTGEGLLSNDINVIFQDSNGLIWIGTNKGLNRFKYGRLIDVMDEIEEFTGYYIRTIFEDKSKNLWIGSKRGLSLIKGGIIRHFKLSENSFYDVLAIYESPADPGLLWIGTNGMGLLKLKDRKFTRYTTDEGLYNNYIFSINEVNNKSPLKGSLNKGVGRYLWMSSYTGVFRVSIDTLNKYSKNAVKSFISPYYTETDGMESSECVGGTQPSAWKTEQGKLYFPTVKGVAIFNTDKVTKNRKLPSVVIEDVIVDNKSVLSEKDLRFSRDKHMFEFYFAILSYTAPKKIRFKYKLEGFEEEWIMSESGQKRSALYLNLKPGNYTFRVIACNNDGVWNERGASFKFLILPNFIQRNLVFIVLLFLLLIFIVGFFLFRYNKIPFVKKSKKKYLTSALTDEIADQILGKLIKVMNEEKIYLDPDLTLKKLSEKLMVHYNHLSQIVNEKLNKSFNDFINSYRIKEAELRLIDPKDKRKTILEIAYDVGFYSKSVFNTAFKKFTGVTPSQFRKGNK